MPSERPDLGVIVDTMVVHYFTMVGRFSLLAEILGGLVCVPTSVYECADEGVESDGPTLSEIDRGRRFHRRRSTDPEAAPHLRERSAAALPHFIALQREQTDGRLVTLDLTPSELLRYADFRDREYVRPFGLLAELGRGEASALSMAESRGARLATDDNDCIKLAGAVCKGVQVVRIRGLLLEGVTRSIIGRSEARSVHEAMLQAGFWDKGRIDGE